MRNKKKLTLLVDSGFDKRYKSFLELKYDLTVYTLKDIKDENFEISPKSTLVLFTGGADVDPNIYGESVGKHTHVDLERDKEEQQLFYKFDYLPKLGICRGSQFLTVMSGGRLIQHVTGHRGNHYIHVKTDHLDNPGDYLNYEITSTHHQMMYPFNLSPKNYVLIGWSKRFQSDAYLNGNNEQIVLPEGFVEPEIVYYPNSRSLCIQGHPEYPTCPNSTKRQMLILIDKFLMGQSVNEKALIQQYQEW